MDIICLKKRDQAICEQINGANVLRIPLTHKRLGIVRYFFEYALSFVMMSIAISYLFVRKRYDCIQVCTMPDFLVFTTIIPKLLGAKVLLDLHEPTPEVWVTKFGNRLCPLLLLQEKMEQWAISYADMSLTVTEKLRRRFVERGADINKITVIPNVCEDVFEKTFYDSLKEKPTVTDNVFRLVTHGLIEERYGHDLVIKALKILHDNLPGIHYYIIGAGEYKQNLVELVQKLDCGDRAHFLGFLSFEDLLQELLKADVGIIAMEKSPYSELVDTNKMYEYIAMRKPVILSRLSAVEENFDDSCVMFFEPGNHEDLARCIAELYYSPEKRHDLAENAYRRYEKMRWSETKRIYLDVVEDLIGKKRG